VLDAVSFEDLVGFEREHQVPAPLVPLVVAEVTFANRGRGAFDPLFGDAAVAQHDREAVEGE